MKPAHIALLVASMGISASAAANDSAYDLLIVACDSSSCKRIADQTVTSGSANTAEYRRNGLRLMIETLARRSHEEDARVSLDVRQADHGRGTLRATAASLAQRLETLVVQCTLKHGTFSPLTSFVTDGTTYQIWARLAVMR